MYVVLVTTTTITTTKPRPFEVVTVQTGAPRAATWHADHDEAVADAASRVGANVTQASITTWTGCGDTFAVRHFVHEAGGVRDTGWRGWQHGEFVGDVVVVQA